MMKKQVTKLIHEAKYVAQVDVEVIESDTGWSPCLSLDAALKLDTVRKLLLNNDLKGASEIARVFSLTPVAI